MEALNAGSMTRLLWESLNGLRSGNVSPESGKAIAEQAREINRTIRLQLQITAQAKRDVPADVLAFAEK